MAIVVGGILALRMHAFLALILAALVVAALTPASNVYWASLGQEQVASLQPEAATHGTDLAMEPPTEVGADWSSGDIAVKMYSLIF